MDTVDHDFVAGAMAVYENRDSVNISSKLCLYHWNILRISEKNVYVYVCDNLQNELVHCSGNRWKISLARYYFLYCVNSWMCSQPEVRISWLRIFSWNPFKVIFIWSFIRRYSSNEQRHFHVAKSHNRKNIRKPHHRPVWRWNLPRDLRLL